MADIIKETEPYFNSEPIDEMVQHLQKKYIDKVDEIIDLPLYSDLATKVFKKREELEKWILDPINNVRVIIAFSGGKDSIAMVLKALDMGIPKERIELWHHDIDGEGEDLFDWKCTKSYCIAFANAFGIKILFSYRKGGIVREIYKQNEVSQPIYFQKEMGGEFFVWEPEDNPAHYNTRLKFPSVGADLQTRWCSYQVKIDVMQKAITHSERFSNANLVIMTGERRDESKNRGKYAEIDVYEARVNRGKSFIPEEKKNRWLKEAQGEFVSPIFVEKWELPVGAFNGEGAGAN